jgi:hypothetical protein
MMWESKFKNGSNQKISKLYQNLSNRLPRQSYLNKQNEVVKFIMQLSSPTMFSRKALSEFSN